MIAGIVIVVCFVLFVVMSCLKAGSDYDDKMRQLFEELTGSGEGEE